MNNLISDDKYTNLSNNIPFGGYRIYNSNFSRCLMIASMLSNDQSTNWLSSGMSVNPRFVNLYSTCDGISG